MKRIAWLAGLLLASSSLLFACKCAPLRPGPTTRRALAELNVKGSDVIFAGRVDHIELKNWPLKPVPGATVVAIPRLVATFSDIRLYRGQTASFSVETGLDGDDCGYPFETGRSYLVFALREDTGQLSTGICSATEPLEEAGGAELRLLRGEPPAPEDLADLRNEKNEPSPPRSETKVCGKVHFPKGVNSADVTVYFWSDRGFVLPFIEEEVDAEPDGSFCKDLDPGKYLVAALDDAHSGFRYIGYYPGGSGIAQATPVTVSGKGVTSRVEFPLARQHLYTVRGFLRGVPETENETVQVLLMAPQPELFNLFDPVSLGPHGVFEFTEVPSGHYTAFAFRSNEEGTVTFLSDVVALDVGENVEGLRLGYVSPR